VVTAPLDVDRTEVHDALEALGQRGAVEATRVRRVGNLEQDAAQLVVDLLVVPVLRLAPDALEHRTQTDLAQQVRVEEGHVQRHDELDLVPVDDDLDALSLDGIQLGLRVVGGLAPGLDLAVDHAVGPVADGGELVGERRVGARLVALVRRELDAQRRQELVVGDPLLLRAHDLAGDLELEVLTEERRQLGHDAVVLAGEQRVRRGQCDVLVRADVTGDGRLVRGAQQAAIPIGRRCGGGVAPGRGLGQVVVGQQQRSAVVRRVAVAGAVAQPVQPIGRVAVHR
jgi:hypothetical protein